MVHEATIYEAETLKRLSGIEKRIRIVEIVLIVICLNSGIQIADYLGGGFPSIVVATPSTVDKVNPPVVSVSGPGLHLDVVEHARD